ncbi:MAG: HIT domain-containing protein [Nitrospinota bacterium]|nr:HIT domain-containing protein [Nitrospinota bacterium]
MKQLWAPWRIEYVLREKEKECVFCKMQGEEKDRENSILYRGKTNFIVLNIYPYNNGHLMVIPYRHTSELTGITGEEMDENGRLVQKSVEILQERFKPHGFNIGMNVGSPAGAGIDEHIHMHVVPRWSGDTNFMPVVGEVRVLPQHIRETYDALIESFKGIVL